MEGLAGKDEFKFEAVITFYHFEEDDFRPRVYSSTKEEERRVVFEIYLSRCGIYIPIDINLNNPVEAGLLEEFKALCRKSIRWRYYRYGVNWFDRLVKEADEIYTRKDLGRLVGKLREKDVLEVAFGEKEGKKYVFTTGILFVFKRKEGLKFVDDYERVCAKYAEEKVERVLEKFKDKSEFWWKDLVDDVKPRIRYYLGEKSVIKWLTKYVSSGGVEAKTELADKIVLTRSKIENLCLKRKFKDTVAVEFEYCSVKIFFIALGLMLKLRCEEGIEFFKELKEECDRKIKYRFYSNSLNMYSVLFNRAYRIETYGPVPRVFNKLGPLSVEVSFGEKNDEKHVIMHKNRAIVHFAVRGEHVRYVEEYEDECRKEVYRLYREKPRVRYYLDEDYMLKWLKRYLEVVGLIEVKEIGGKARMEVTLENVDKVFGKGRPRV